MPLKAKIINQSCELGSLLISDTDSHAGLTIDHIQVVGAVPAVFASLTGNMEDFVPGLSVPVGAVIHGEFTELELTSGQVIAYRKIQ